MHWDWEDAIVAPATPPQGGRLGILRASGIGIGAVLDRAGLRPVPTPSVGPAGGTEVGGSWKEWLASLRWAQQVAVELPLSEGVALPGTLCGWPAGRSYTGQPLVEFQTLGSSPLVQRALREFAAAGARLAQPGEFTLRAFLAGRMDLTQAEAVLGVVHARHDDELTAALGQLAGGLRTQLEELRGRLLDLLAHLEAGLDFVDEDIEFITTAELTETLTEAVGRTSRLLAAARGRNVAETAPRVVLYGEPNAGKSSLFNALRRRFGLEGSAEALVSPLPGTTRDHLAARIRWQGREWRLVDTAGREDPEGDAIASAAQRLRTQQQSQATVRLWCVVHGLPTTDWERLEQARPDPRRLVVATQCDSRDSFQAASPNAAESTSGAVSTSARDGTGLDELAEAVERLLSAGPTVSRPDSSFQQAVSDDCETAADGDDSLALVASTAVRCQESLREAHGALVRALAAVPNRLGEELIAAEVRAGLDHLGQVTGEVYTDDVLDRVFSRFCIGK